MHRPGWRSLMGWCLAVLSPGMALAQLESVPLDRPGQRPLPLPAPETQPAPRLDLPPVELRPEDQRRPAALRVQASGFRFVGNTVFSDTELSLLLRPYLQRELDAEDIETIRLTLTRYYIDRGYLNSGAILPDQKIADGIITFQLVEGRLTRIEVQGQQRLAASYFEDRIRLRADGPLNVYAIREQLYLLQQDPRVRRLDAALLPGVRPGEATLRVTVEEEPSQRLTVGGNNHRPPSVGSSQGLAEFVDLNLFGWADTFALNYGVTRGLDSVDANYTVPVNAYDTSMVLRYARNESAVQEEAFQVLDIRSRYSSFSLGLWQPYRPSAREEYGAGLLWERRFSQTFLLGEPFPFSPNTDDYGKTHVTAWRLQNSWLTRDSTQVMAARSTLSYGTHSYDASVGPIEPDARFVAWLGQFQWVARMTQPGEEFVARMDLQLANDPLLSLEQFAVGGANSVRGYRENFLVRDNGAVGSLEYRIPVPYVTGDGHLLQLAPFFDIGHSWNRNRPTYDPRTLSSVGFGLCGSYRNLLEYQLYKGVRLRHIDPPTEPDLQDRGIHFQLRLRVL